MKIASAEASDSQKQIVSRVLAAAEVLCEGLVGFTASVSVSDCYASARIIAIRILASQMASVRGIAVNSVAEFLSDSLVPGLDSATIPVDCLRRAELIICEKSIEELKTTPPTVLGRTYQTSLDVEATSEGGEILYGTTRSSRKAAGQFFTPPALVDYIVRKVLEPLIEDAASSAQPNDLPGKLLSIKILDPSCGCGDFLVAASRYIGEAIASRTGTEAQYWAHLAAQRCVYGVDIDPVAVAIAKTALYVDSGAAEEPVGVFANIRQGNSLALDWASEFPGPMSDGGGFDAVIGNPPYVARKNEGRSDYQRVHGGRGQSDYYLLFLSNVIQNRLVRPGGYLSMVLPDPFLVRGNGSAIRRTLIAEWTMKSVLHIKGMFVGAGVANAVPVCQNRPNRCYDIQVGRVESSLSASGFSNDGHYTEAYSVPADFALSQPGCEILYLANSAACGNAYTSIHGCGSFHTCKEPFIALGDLPVEIFRGEEIGKGAITSHAGELSILLGGQSIRCFHINYEGRRIERDAVKKPLERYLCEKLVLQKSTGKLIAAIDIPTGQHPGYVTPQSVYCIRSLPGGPSLYYLLALLNSEVLNDYARRVFTGYKLLQPQIEIEDLKHLPIRKLRAHTPDEDSEKVAASAFKQDADTMSQVADWLSKGREGLAHDLIVYLSKQIVNSAGQSTVETLQLLNNIIRLLYGLPTNH